MSTNIEEQTPIKKTITIDYDVWAKLRGIQTILAEKEKEITFSEIIDRGCHLLTGTMQQDLKNNE